MHEEPCEEGRLREGSRDGAADGTREDATDGTLDMALDKASDEEEAKCKWDDWDGVLTNKYSVSHA